MNGINTPEDLMSRIEETNKTFKKFWEENGSPHPNSNAYLRLMKIHFFCGGMNVGLQMARNILKETD